MIQQIVKPNGDVIGQVVYESSLRDVLRIVHVSIKMRRSGHPGRDTWWEAYNQG